MGCLVARPASRRLECLFYPAAQCLRDGRISLDLGGLVVLW